MMLPASCDPGYAWLGHQLGAQDLVRPGASSSATTPIPPLDLPGVVASYFPPRSFFHGNLPGLAYSAIGQQDVRATALQDALVAAAVANHGKEMAPHFLSLITDANGNVVKRYHPYLWRHPIGPGMAAQIVPLMQAVVTVGHSLGRRLPPPGRRRGEDRHRPDGRRTEPHRRLDDRVRAGD